MSHLLALAAALLIAGAALVSPVDIGRFHYAKPMSLSEFFLLLGVTHAMASVLGAIVGGLLAYDARDQFGIYERRTDP